MKRLKSGLLCLGMGIGLLAPILPQPTNTTIIYANEPGPVSKSGYVPGILDRFRIDAPDPEGLTGETINRLLDRYPQSRLRGQGDTILRLANQYGVNVGAYLGQVGKETTFGSANCGGAYNFGCMMWAEWMGVPKAYAVDRAWADPATPEQGIELQMRLLRNNYIDKGFVYYPDYLERYAPSFENDHQSNESLMYAVLRAIGQPIDISGQKQAGGLSATIDWGQFKLTLKHRQDFNGDHVFDAIKDQVQTIEWLEHPNMEQVGTNQAKARVTLKDGTKRDVTVDVTIEPVIRTIAVTNVETGKTIEVQMTSDQSNIDISPLAVDPSKPHQAIKGSEALVHMEKLLPPEPIIIPKSKTLPIKEKDGKIKLTLNDTNQAHIYLQPESRPVDAGGPLDQRPVF